MSKELDALERLIEKQRIVVEGIQSGVPMGEDGAVENMKLNQNDPNYKRIYEVPVPFALCCAPHISSILAVVPRSTKAGHSALDIAAAKGFERLQYDVCRLR
jgi:hypothetical protein